MEHYLISNDISGVMVSMLASSVVDRWFKPWSGQAMVGTSHGRDKPWSGQAKDYLIGIYCFSTKHAAWRDYMSE